MGVVVGLGQEKLKILVDQKDQRIQPRLKQDFISGGESGIKAEENSVLVRNNVFWIGYYFLDAFVNWVPVKPAWKIFTPFYSFFMA